MRGNLFRNVVVLAMIGAAAFAYFDPLKPSEDEAKSAVLAALLASADGDVTALSVGRSFTGRRVDDGFKTRLWPVHATVTVGAKELPDHDFLLWKLTRGGWTAETSDPKDKHWDNTGFFGVDKFGM